MFIAVLCSVILISAFNGGLIRCAGGEGRGGQWDAYPTLFTSAAQIQRLGVVRLEAVGVICLRGSMEDEVRRAEAIFKFLLFSRAFWVLCESHIKNIPPKSPLPPPLPSSLSPYPILSVPSHTPVVAASHEHGTSYIFWSTRRPLATFTCRQLAIERAGLRKHTKWT